MFLAPQPCKMSHDTSPSKMQTSMAGAMAKAFMCKLGTWQTLRKYKTDSICSAELASSELEKAASHPMSFQL